VEQRVGVEGRQRDEHTGFREGAAGHEGMDVGMKVQQLAVRLDAELKMRSAVLLLALGAGFVLQAKETSENNQRLKESLKRYPKAAANGVLSMELAKA
jgi:hypothetical protein